MSYLDLSLSHNLYLQFNFFLLDPQKGDPRRRIYQLYQSPTNVTPLTFYNLNSNIMLYPGFEPGLNITLNIDMKLNN